VTDLSDLALRLEELVRNKQQTRQTLGAAKRERDQYRQLYLEMMEGCHKLKLGLAGRKAAVAFDVRDDARRAGAERD
jgi:hypothetical protein